MLHLLSNFRKITKVVPWWASELDQLALGLRPVLKAALEQPTICQLLFVFEDTAKITVEKFKALLNESHLEDKNLKGYFHQYINSNGGNELKDVLSFCTGSSTIPPMGFDNPSQYNSAMNLQYLTKCKHLPHGIGTSLWAILLADGSGNCLSVNWIWSCMKST